MTKWLYGGVFAVIVLVCVLLGTCVLFVGHCIEDVDNIAIAIQSVPTATTNAIATEGVETRKLVDKHATKIEQVAVQQVKDTRKSLEKMVEERGDAIDNQLTTFNKHVGTVSDATEKLAGIRDDVKPVVDHTAKTVEFTSRIAEGFARKDALSSNVLGAVAAFKRANGEFAKTSIEVSKAAPSIVKNFDKTTANVERITRPSKWYIQVGRAVVPAALGYFLGKK